ncbi:DUF2312 domain-containing protein [Azospirillum tabaci]|uniref:DUF2312 domain-containing protein n=1 Tax=Azospirillum tabaci TaxID=2752310 RepID=UPI0016600C60|nr:DUF2312 domain-containing protein [Azospirillum tabaci]
MTATAQDMIKQFADRMERLLDEIDGLKEDLKELRAEVKGAGFNVKALDKLVAIRRKDTNDKEAEFINDLILYANVTGTRLGVVTSETEPTPIEQAIAASKAKEPDGFDPETGEVFDPVRRMAEGLACGDERIQRSAKFPPGTELHISPGAGRADWPADLPTSFIAGADGHMRAEARP